MMVPLSLNHVITIELHKYRGEKSFFLSLMIFDHRFLHWMRSKFENQISNVLKNLNQNVQHIQITTLKK